ncbi:hypothetical protein Csp2054_07265 [Curtobacterium sp. 'Ferrero']|nr:hypothetical protein Csp2054_07265 [Curtobacterium sp. 'Ferrero']
MTGKIAVVVGGSTSALAAADSIGVPRCAARRARSILVSTTTATIDQMPLTMSDGMAWCAPTLTAIASPPTRLRSWYVGPFWSLPVENKM